MYLPPTAIGKTMKREWKQNDQLEIAVLWLQNSSAQDISVPTWKSTLTARNRTAINQIFEPMTQGAEMERAPRLRDAWENLSFIPI